MFKISRIAVAAALFALANSASAEFYVGAKVGSTDIDVDVDGLNADRDIGYNLNVGYQFNKHFGLEVAYVDLGGHDLDFGDIDEAVVDSLNVNSELSADGFDISLVGTLPLSEAFDLYGKVGYFTWESDLNVSVSSSLIDESFSDTTSIDGNDISFAVGAAYALTDELDVNLEFSRYDLDGADADFIGLGVKFSF